MTPFTAPEILDNMRTVVESDMLIYGRYATEEPMDRTRIGSVCGGYKFCAIGALFVGSGIPPGDVWRAAIQHNRADEFRERPELKVAYVALNHAAEHWADQHSVDPYGFHEGHHRCFASALEGLFEGAHGHPIDRDALLEIIDDAKGSLTSAPV